MGVPPSVLRSCATTLLVLSACRSAPPVDTLPDPVPEVEAPPYTEVRQALEEHRVALGARWAAAEEAERPVVLAEATSVLLDVVADGLLPAWYGTPWAFYGTSQVPGQGQIACGYLVSTVLEHAGFRVERVALAQQAAEHIILTMVPPDRVHRFRERSREEVVADVQEQGEGLYIVGLDYHVGFLLVRDDGSGSPAVQMCHSSWLGSSGALCEPAATSPAMISSYTVTGPVLTEPTVVAWLEGRSLPTVGEAHL